MTVELWDPGIQARFWAKVQESESGCWEWTASKTGSGYGNFYLDGRYLGAHRIAYRMMIDEVPDGLHLDHLCRNRACVNPYHLDPVTVKVNAVRGVRGMKTHCLRGHEFTPENTRMSGTSRCCRTCDRASAIRSWEAKRAASKL